MKLLLAPRIQDLLYLTVLLLTSYLLIFHNLGKAQIRIWDEATYANNAIDMYEQPGNPLVIRHLGEPDLYNVKPPLVIWLQALNMHIWGVNEWAIRFPSALFGLFTVLTLYGFCSHVLNNRLVGFLAGMILLSSAGFIRNHVVRTGDLDAALVFFSMLLLMAFWALMLTNPKNKKPYYILLAVGIVGAFLSKGIAALFFFPAMGFMAFFPLGYKPLKDFSLYGVVLLSLLGCGAYYGLRELAVPGYWPVLRDSEFIRINTEVMSWHLQAADYYWQELKNKHFAHLFWGLPLVPLSFLFVAYRSRSFYFLVYVCFAVLGYFLLISYPPVKLSWYDAPLLPVLALALAFSANQIWETLWKRISLKYPLIRKMEGIYLLIPLFLIPLYAPYSKLWKDMRWAESHAQGLELEGAFLKYLAQSRPELDSLKILKNESYTEHYDPVLFYIRAFQHEQKLGKIELIKAPPFSPGEWVMVAKPEDMAQIDSLYAYTLEEIWQDARLIYIEDTL
ncbi:MAG: glycosyltransferase family 39 protein [Bacteroidota bacterium]